MPTEGIRLLKQREPGRRLPPKGGVGEPSSPLSRSPDGVLRDSCRFSDEPGENRGDVLEPPSRLEGEPTASGAAFAEALTNQD